MASQTMASHPLEGYARHHSESGWSAYELSDNGYSFGVFFVGPDVCTVRWSGVLDFSALHEEALLTLPQVTSPYWPHFQRVNEQAARVSLVVSHVPDDHHDAQNDDPDEDLLEFDLSNERDRNTYSAWIHDPDRIVFARYDVLSVTDHAAMQYSLMAENPHVLERSGRSAHLGVSLPRGQRWTPELARWILDHHADGGMLSELVGPESLAQTLSRLQDQS
jgi:hypothetical protein